MTDREKAIVMAYTGYAMLTGDKLGLFYQYIQEKVGRPVMTHELAEKPMQETIHTLSKPDFVELCITNDEPRVITLDELQMHEVYWAEQDDVSRPWAIAMLHIRNAGLLDGPVYQDYMGDNFNAKEYGVKWRLWTSRPSDEVRRVTPWN